MNNRPKWRHECVPNRKLGRSGRHKVSRRWLLQLRVLRLGLLQDGDVRVGVFPLEWPPSVTKMFAGLMSRWMIPFE